MPAYRSRPKRRTVTAPKFYFSDVGVVNVLAKRRGVEPGSPVFGKALENWVHHELRAYIAYRRRGTDLTYWRLSSGIEVDFVVDDLAFAIEVKSSRKIGRPHLKGLRQLAIEHPGMGRRYVVCLEDKAFRTPDGIDVLPVAEFASRLWGGELLAQ